MIRGAGEEECRRGQDGGGGHRASGKWRRTEDPSRGGLCAPQEGLWRWIVQERGLLLFSLQAANAQPQDEGMEVVLRTERGKEAVRASGHSKPCTLLRTGRCKTRPQAGKLEKFLR